MLVPPDDHTWLGLTDAPLPVGAAADWAVLPSCGAVVLFSGTARDHAPGRDGVVGLDDDPVVVGAADEVPKYMVMSSCLAMA